MKKSRLMGAVCACLFTFCLSTPTIAAVTAYAQDFEALNAADPAALSNDGYWVYADVWGRVGGDATVGTDIFLYNYGPFIAPNSTAITPDAFSGVATGEGGVTQADQYLNIFSDYQNPDQVPGGSCVSQECTINTSVFKEYNPIEAGDIGSIWTFSFDAKSPFAGGIFDGKTVDPNGGDFNNPQSASAFIKSLDPNAGYATTNDIRVDMTNVSNTEWVRYSISLDLSAPELEGQILQFGFNTVSTLYQDSGVYYDNICFSSNGDDCVFTSPVPIPAAAWLFGSGLLGLIGVARRKKVA